jgi:hypothetical protein
LPGKNHIRGLLPDLGAGYGYLVSLAEGDAHLILKRFGAQVDVKLVITALEDELGEIFAGSESEEIDFIDYALGLGLGLKVILGKRMVRGGRFLRECRDGA